MRLDVWSVVRLSRFQLTRQIIGSNRYFWREIGGEKFRTVFCKLRWMFRDLDTPLNMAPLFSGFETKNWKSLQSSSNYFPSVEIIFTYDTNFSFSILLNIKHMKLILTWKYLQKKKMCVFNIELVKWRFNIIYDFIRIISPYIRRI